MAAGGGSKRRYQYCSDDSGTMIYLRALQGHSGSNLIDPTLQDNVVIGSGIFHCIYHIGCAFNLHSNINNGLIPGGQNSNKRQTVFFLPIDPRDTDHKDPEHIDFSVPRRARYVHSAWKKHQDAVFWVDIDPCDQRRINILSNTIGRGRIWPNLFWPSFLAAFGQDHIWPIPHLAKVNWPHLAILIWPNLANFC